MGEGGGEGTVGEGGEWGGGVDSQSLGTTVQAAGSCFIGDVTHTQFLKRGEKGFSPWRLQRCKDKNEDEESGCRFQFCAREVNRGRRFEWCKSKKFLSSGSRDISKTKFLGV